MCKKCRENYAIFKRYYDELIESDYIKDAIENIGVARAYYLPVVIASFRMLSHLKLVDGKHLYPAQELYEEILTARDFEYNEFVKLASELADSLKVAYDHVEETRGLSRKVLLSYCWVIMLIGESVDTPAENMKLMIKLNENLIRALKLHYKNN